MKTKTEVEEVDEAIDEAEDEDEYGGVTELFATMFLLCPALPSTPLLPATDQRWCSCFRCSAWCYLSYNVADPSCPVRVSRSVVSVVIVPRSHSTSSRVNLRWCCLREVKLPVNVRCQ